MATTTERLLQVVWGNRQGYVFLPHKDPEDPMYPRGGWHETDGFNYTGTIPNLEQLPQSADLYFCPVVFHTNKRRKENALPTNVLWADLDPIHPEQCKLRPSIAWESSPGRYQALWLLDQEIDPQEAAELSKRIAYADGGDKGGWDLTQVLRLPGTINHKYDMKPPVKLMWAKNQTYSIGRITSQYPELKHAEENTSLGKLVAVSESQIRQAISSLPSAMKRRLSQSTVGMDRSLELQKLSRDILKLQVPFEIAFHLLQRSSLNKFKGRPDEQKQLLKQLNDARDAITQQTGEKTDDSIVTSNGSHSLPIEEMQVRSWGQFLSIPTQLSWLINDSWVDHTVGFISGRSKSYKTWLALDLVLSVLSGVPFLDQFQVRRTGPVLLIQEEDPTAILQERLKLISKSKGMLPSVEFQSNQLLMNLVFPEYPLSIINLQGFSLTAPEKIAQVRREIGRLNPILVVLDPLIVMLGQTDENKATAIAALLQEVKMWREDFGCNVIIVHHWNKTKTEEGDRGGAHMYGSFAFHAWLESAWHVQPILDADTTKIDTVVVEREFKAAAGSHTLKLKFDINTVDDFRYGVQNLGDSMGAIEEKILEILRDNGSWMNKSELQSLTGFGATSVVTAVGKLTRFGRVEVQPGGGRGKMSTWRIKG